MKRDSNTTVQFANTVQDPHNGNGANHNGSSIYLQPAPPQSQEDAAESKQQFRAIMSAFRRRWFSSLTLGILFGSLVAAATWHLIPAPFSSFAELRINTMQQTLVYKQTEYNSFDTYKQTLSRVIKRPLVLNAALDQVSQSDLEIVPPDTEPVLWLESNLKVSSPAKEFLKIELSGEHPKKLKNVIDAIVDSFMLQIEDETRSKTNTRLQELRKLQSESKTKLEQLNSSLKQLTTITSASTTQQMDDKNKYLLDFKLALQTSLQQINYEIVMLQIQMKDDSDNPLKESDIKIPESLIEAGIRQHRDYLVEEQKNYAHERKVEQWKAIVDEGHPKLTLAEKDLDESDKKLEALKIDLRKEVKDNFIQDIMAKKDIVVFDGEEKLRKLQAQQTGLENNIKDITVKEKVASDNSFELHKLKKDILKEETKDKKYSDIIDMLTTEIDRPSLVTRYRAAQVPSKRDVAKKIKLSGIAGLGGFGFIVIGIVFLEFRFRRISSLDEVADKLSMRVLGTLPLMPRSVTKNGETNKKSRSAFWHSALTESIDATRTMLLREAELESMNVIMVASAMGGEGKTTLACHLSTSLARAGRKTILVDCDLRRPSVSKVYNLGVSSGFCEILRDESKLEECIQDSTIENLSILPAGKINQDILGLLAQNDVGDLFNILKTEYDFVVVDSSPILPVTDSLLIAQHVDAAMFAIRRDISRMAKVGAAVQRMSMLGIPLLGAVAIGLDDESFGFNYPYKYQYGYGYGYRNAYLGYPTSHS